MRLQNERMKAGFTQARLAVESGVSLRTIQQYENGQRSVDGANLMTLCKLCETIGCTLFDILESEELRLKLKSVT